MGFGNAAALAAQMVAPEPVDRCLKIVDVPTRSSRRGGFDWRCELELFRVGWLVETGFGDVGDGVHSEAAEPVEYPNRLEYAPGYGGFDACDDLGGARGGLDRRESPSRSLHDRIMRSLDEIGGLFDHVKHQIYEAAYTSHMGGV
ncbi:MAG: hypothetical protein JRE19_13225 [Deltaproteobacteria bacterium]|nr:hypothetical protein [Deltaproteobacteria bacterium]